MLSTGTLLTEGVAEAMKIDVADIYRRCVEDLVDTQRSESPCPYDGLTCCSICVDCGKRFCECAAPNSCERMSGVGCSGTRGEGCPKGWGMKA